MAGNNLTPRQKMINLLYLVLVAMLALNVSSEVLDAFKTVNDGINLTNNSQLNKNGNIFNDLNRQFIIDPVRTKDAYEKAIKAHDLSQKLRFLLEQYKTEMISEAGGIDTSTGKIHRDDDINIPTRIFVENDEIKGKQLQKDIQDTRMQLLALLNEQDRRDAELSLALKVDQPANGEPWEYARFNHVPVVAAVTLLSKYENDVLSAEGTVEERLFHSINAHTIPVDHMEARVMSPSSYVIEGQPYQADIMVEASSSTLVPEVFLGGFTGAVKKDERGNYLPIESASDALPLVSPVKVNAADGIGKLSVTDNSAGIKKYAGVIRVKDATSGKYKFYPFDGSYQVAPKTVVVSPTMENVMYIGLDNTIDVSVPGIAQSDVSAGINNGTLTKNADGKYIARVVKAGTAMVEVNAKVNGHEVNMGEQKFRVKRVPDPVTTLDGIYKGGKIKLSQIKNSRGVVAKVENFDPIAGFKVESFQFIFNSKKSVSDIQIDNAGPAYNDKITAIVSKQLQPGDNIFIDQIIVRGPAGDHRKINPIAFQVVQ